MKRTNGKTGKHCHNCAFLDWFEDSCYEQCGWMCNKRNYDTVKAESEHLRNLEREEYRFKGKKCFELKLETKASKT